MAKLSLKLILATKLIVYLLFQFVEIVCACMCVCIYFKQKQSLLFNKHFAKSTTQRSVKNITSCHTHKKKVEAGFHMINVVRKYNKIGFL